MGLATGAVGSYLLHLEGEEWGRCHRDVMLASQGEGGVGGNLAERAQTYLEGSYNYRVTFLKNRTKQKAKESRNSKTVHLLSHPGAATFARHTEVEVEVLA